MLGLEIVSHYVTLIYEIRSCVTHFCFCLRSNFRDTIAFCLWVSLYKMKFLLLQFLAEFYCEMSWKNFISFIISIYDLKILKNEFSDFYCCIIYACIWLWNSIKFIYCILHTILRYFSWLSWKNNLYKKSTKLVIQIFSVQLANNLKTLHR